MQERSWSCRSRTWWFLCSPPQVYKVYNVLLDVTLFQRLSHFLIQLQCPHAWPETQRKQKPNNELKDAAQLLWHSFMTFHHEQLKKKKNNFCFRHWFEHERYLVAGHTLLGELVQVSPYGVSQEVDAFNWLTFKSLCWKTCWSHDKNWGQFMLKLKSYLTGLDVFLQPIISNPAKCGHSMLV